MSELLRLLNSVEEVSFWVELAVLVLCVGLAGWVAYLLGRNRVGDSILFGEKIFDGLLLPVLTAVFVYLSRYAVGVYWSVVLLDIASTITLSLVVIRLCVRVLRASFPQSKLILLVERLLSWLIWLITVLWITGFLPSVMKELDQISVNFGKTKISLLMVIEGGFSLLSVIIVVLWVSSAIEKKILNQTVEDLSLRKIFFNVIRVLLLLIGFLLVLSALGVDLTALSIFGGAIGVGIGFGMQQLASNYVSGFVILLERSIRIGDVIKADDFQGVVVDINARYTLLRSMEGVESVVPNEQLMTQRVESLTAGDDCKGILQTMKIIADRDCDADRVVDLIDKVVASESRVLKEPAPRIHLLEFDTYDIQINLSYWILDFQRDAADVRTALGLQILRGLGELGQDSSRMSGMRPIEKAGNS